jgi:DNA-binding response OmpR family regulator
MLSRDVAAISVTAVEAVVVTRLTDRWLPSLTAALAQVGVRRPYLVHTLGDAETAVAARGPDLVVFEPTVVGADFPGVLRGRGIQCLQVGWLSSRSSPVVATLFAAGADEVLDATMGEEELTARLHQCLSRLVAVVAAAVDIGALHVDARQKVADWAGSSLRLTGREIEVLQVLAAAHPRPVRRHDLYRLVWGWAMPRGDRTVDVNVKRIRDKLARAAVDVEIRTESGLGYRLALEARRETVTGL